MSTATKIIGGFVALTGLGLLFAAASSARDRIVSRHGAGHLPANAKLLFIGDSYTAFDDSYADQLKDNMPGISIKKIAKVGAKTDWMLQNMPSAQELSKYDAVFILGGLNDIYALDDINYAKGNLSKMYAAVNAAGSKAIGITIPPTDFYDRWDAGKGELTTELSTWIKDNDALYASIDLNKLLRGETGRQNPLLFADDELHATAQAHGSLATKTKKLFA